VLLQRVSGTSLIDHLKVSLTDRSTGRMEAADIGDRRIVAFSNLLYYPAPLVFDDGAVIAAMTLLTWSEHKHVRLQWGFSSDPRLR
jgi:hypothetical protein